MNVRVIFVTLILVSVLAMSNLSENLAFAAKEDKVDLTALQKLIDDLVSVIDEIRVILDTLRIDFDTEVQARENADAALEIKIDNLIISYEGDKETAAVAATVSPYYSNTIIITTVAGTSYTETISCEDGDTATSANFVKLETPLRFLQVVTSYQQNDSSFTFLFANSHPVKSLDIELTINCLRTEV